MADTHSNNKVIRGTPSHSACYLGTSTSIEQSTSTTPSTTPIREPQPSAKRDVSSDSSDETEEGFVVLGDEFSAPWDGDQTQYQPPTLVDKAVQTAKHTWGALSMASIQDSLGGAASSLAERALAGLPRRRESSIQDVSGWHPPRNAFASTALGLHEVHREGRGSSAPSEISRETKLQTYRAQLDEKKRRRPGPAFVLQEEEYDPLGDSVAWQGRDGRGGGRERRRVLLEEWRAREERGESEQCGRVRRNQGRGREVGQGLRT
ncbi:MAG: hypothetical protein M1830_005757, partial [Pleopsidium flavum]